MSRVGRDDAGEEVSPAVDGRDGAGEGVSPAVGSCDDADKGTSPAVGGCDGADKEVSPVVNSRRVGAMLTGIRGIAACAESPSAYARPSCIGSVQACLIIPGSSWNRTLGGLPRGLFISAG